MAAIFTRYIGPTNYRGSRVKAWIPGHKPVIVSYDDEFDSSENHQRAAEKCATIYDAWRNEHARVPWPKCTVTLIGESPDQRGYTFHLK